jgi:hypothetical protein
MATADEIGQEKQGISERLPRLDAERTRLGGKLNELEIAERADTLRRKSGYYQGAEERTLCETCASGHWVAQRRRWPAGAHQVAQRRQFEGGAGACEGATAPKSLSYLSREFGMTVRPNRLGIALQRRRRAGRLEPMTKRQRWKQGGNHRRRPPPLNSRYSGEAEFKTGPPTSPGDLGPAAPGGAGGTARRRELPDRTWPGDRLPNRPGLLAYSERMT